MNSKRGSLPVDELVKFFLGAIVLIAIIAILVIFFNIVSGTLHKQQAKTNLDNIAFEAEKMTDGQTREILIESPKDWVIMGRNRQLCSCKISSELFPLKSEATTSKSLDQSFDLCKKNGICKDINLELILSRAKCAPYGYLIDSSRATQILSCLHISRVPFSVTLEKNKDTINIYSKESTWAGTAVSGWGAQNENCKISDFNYNSSLIDAGQKYILPSFSLEFSDCNLGILSASKVDFFLKCLKPTYGSTEFHYPASVSKNSCDSLEVSQERGLANFSSCGISKSLLPVGSASSCELGVNIYWFGTQSEDKVNGVWIERTTKVDFGDIEFTVDQSDKKCEVYSIKYLDKLSKTYYGFLFETDCSQNDFASYLSSLPVTGLDGNDSWSACTNILTGDDKSKRLDELDVSELKSSSNGHNFIKVNYPFLVSSPSFSCSKFVFYVSGKEFFVDVPVA